MPRSDCNPQGDVSDFDRFCQKLGPGLVIVVPVYDIGPSRIGKSHAPYNLAPAVDVSDGGLSPQSDCREGHQAESPRACHHDHRTLIQTFTSTPAHSSTVLTIVVKSASVPWRSAVIASSSRMALP